MDTHDMLVELLAIKLFEHEPLGNDSLDRHRMSWIQANPEDRQDARNRVLNAIGPEALYHP